MILPIKLVKGSKYLPPSQQEKRRNPYILLRKHTTYPMVVFNHKHSSDFLRPSSGGRYAGPCPCLLYPRKESIFGVKGINIQRPVRREHTHPVGPEAAAKFLSCFSVPSESSREIDSFAFVLCCCCCRPMMRFDRIMHVF